MNNAFNVRIGWLILRILAVVFAWMTFYELVQRLFTQMKRVGLLFSSLLPTLVAVFLFAALFLPLLMEYGLLEMLGPILDRL